MKRIDLCDVEQYDSGFPPDDAVGFMTWLGVQIAAIPAQFSAKAKIEVTSRGGYDGDSYGRICIYYMRPFTPEEEAANVREEQRRREYRESEERRQLAALQAKYGS